jgi:hypothetical protein
MNFHTCAAGETKCIFYVAHDCNLVTISQQRITQCKERIKQRNQNTILYEKEEFTQFLSENEEIGGIGYDNDA